MTDDVKVNVERCSGCSVSMGGLHMRWCPTLILEGGAEGLGLTVKNRVQQIVVRDVVERREYQDEKWGSAAHDDKHSIRDWVTYLVAYLGRIVSRENKWGADSPLARKLFIDVAALAVAAVEAMDRRHLDWEDKDAEEN
jgi:hypothetical protein